MLQEAGHRCCPVLGQECGGRGNVGGWRVINALTAASLTKKEHSEQQ